MTAPKFVPIFGGQKVATYHSAPLRRGTWSAKRPGETVGSAMPTGGRFGSQGPDQGFVLTLIRDLTDRFTVPTGAAVEDMTAVIAATALRRASLFGRAPSQEDVLLAASLWGFLKEKSGDVELVAQRDKYLQGVANPHHYPQLRTLIAAVTDPQLGA